MSFRALAAAAVVAAVLVAAVGVLGYQLGQESAGGDLGASVSTEDAETDLSPLIELYADLRQKAVDVPSQDELVRGAIEGMLETLDDDYARYFPPDAMEAFQSGISGEFVGIGVYLEETPEGATVLSVIPDTPAQRADLESGWRIVSVNGENVRDEPLDAISRRVQGQEGTEVTVGFETPDGETPELTLTRQSIDIPTVETEVRDQVGVVRMIQFTTSTATQFDSAVQRLTDQEGVKGLVLDLRNNGGGVLDQAVNVSDRLLSEGVVVRVLEADGRKRVLRSSDGGTTDLPVVVVVNGGSASASEILAGALQQRDRATIVGTSTFGKGTVQTITHFANGSGAKFTTARYELPGGKSIEGQGIQPDRVVEDSQGQMDTALKLLRSKVAEAAKSPS
jgi:carboxyl-terminal processing protease